ncbi:DUF3006 domain-containing protein [Egicoccus sp. AB-alg2]|uniref:DUF3006 domain-containing protein n=1 Tax=Egicoccus sp. AB-alg2 TaxID=3242693 RepID=UPI00359CBE5C
MPDAEPTGIKPDRAMVDRVEAGTAVLLVGPGRTPLHVDAAELPQSAGPGTWVVLDLQSTPPLVLSVDAELSREGPAR